MGTTTQQCVLFIGRSEKLAQQLSTLLRTEPNDEQAGDTASEFLVANNQKHGLQLVRKLQPAVVVLETGLKNGDRTQFAQLVRQRLPTARIIKACRHCDEMRPPFDHVIQLPLADDRPSADLLQIFQLAHSPLTHFGEFALDRANRTLTTPRGEFRLRPKENALLELLLAQRNRVVSRTQIMKEVWETDFTDDTRTIDVHVRWLRSYLEEDPSQPLVLLTVRKQGYRLVVSD